MLIESDFPELTVAIIFHDIVYDGSLHDEENSIQKMYSLLKPTHSLDIKEVEKLILSTKSLERDTPLNRLDKAILYSQDMAELLQWEEGIFFEYQATPLENYLRCRASFLELAYSKTFNEKLLILNEIIQNKKYKIGVFPGSFNPFHKGHLSVLNQAEEVFDKVIIAFGLNPEKTPSDIQIPSSIYNREMIIYETSLYEAIKDIKCTIIRGIRDNSDLLYEEKFQKFFKDFDTDNRYKFSYFLTDPKYSHVSSSAMRQGFKELLSKYSVL